MLRFLNTISVDGSYGQSLIVIVQGLPSGLSIDAEEIDEELREFYIEYDSPKWQYAGGATFHNNATITAGIRNGLTIGSPLCLNFSPIRNSVLEWDIIREFISRVIVGTVAKTLLKEFGISLLNHIISINGIQANVNHKSFEQIKERTTISLLRCADKEAETRMIKAIDETKKSGDVARCVFEVRVINLPIGLGSSINWDRRLDGRLSQAVMSIPGVTGIEIGVLPPNNVGGLECGVTNGQPLCLRATVLPEAGTSSLVPVIADSIIGEAVVAIELCRAMQEKFFGDTVMEMKNNYHKTINDKRI